MRAILWSKTTSYAWNSFAKGNACSYDCCRSSGYCLGLYRSNTYGIWTRSRDICRSWIICSVAYPIDFCIWPPSVPNLILTDPKYCFSNDGKFWSYNSVSHFSVLASSFQIWPWEQRCYFGKCYLLLDECDYIVTLCQVFSFLQKDLVWLFKRSFP